MEKYSIGKSLIQDCRIKDLKEFNNTDFCELNNLIKELEDELVLLKNILENENTEDEERGINYVLMRDQLQRSIRIKRTYLFDRQSKIIDNILNGYDISDNLLSEDEKKFISDFKSNLSEYYEDYESLDINFYIEEPVLDLYIEVYCKEDCGYVMDGEEFIELKKNMIYYLKKSSVRHLISQNLIKVL